MCLCNAGCAFFSFIPLRIFRFVSLLLPRFRLIFRLLFFPFIFHWKISIAQTINFCPLEIRFGHIFIVAVVVIAAFSSNFFHLFYAKIFSACIIRYCICLCMSSMLWFPGRFFLHFVLFLSWKRSVFFSSTASLYFILISILYAFFVYA